MPLLMLVSCCLQGIGCSSVQRKKAMLEQEGVKFLGDKVRWRRIKCCCCFHRCCGLLSARVWLGLEHDACATDDRAYLVFMHANVARSTPVFVDIDLRCVPGKNLQHCTTMLNLM
jgi:hypothetical protein